MEETFNHIDAKQLMKDIVQAVRDKKPLLGAEGPMTPLVKAALELALKVEMEEHLSDEKKLMLEVLNRKNGKTTKKMASSLGHFDLETPRDRKSTFEPQLIKKRQTVLTQELDQKIIKLFSHGMSYADISENIKDLYGKEISDSVIHQVTEQIIPLMTEWRSRPLEKTYAIVFLDAMYFKSRDNGAVKTKVLYNILGVKSDGRKEVLGFYTAESEGAHFWLNVLNDLKSRGVEDILIACIDGLKGFPESIATLYPRTEVQLCIVHQIRNSLKYVGTSVQKEFLKELKTVYQAPNKDIAFENLLSLESKWGKKYSLAIKPWLNNWELLTVYFKFSPDIRKLIYTTNPIEGLHRQIRKYTKSKGAFTSENALLKMVYCVIENLSEKWSMSLRNWSSTLSQLDIYFPDRIVTH